MHRHRIVDCRRRKTLDREKGDYNFGEFGVVESWGSRVSKTKVQLGHVVARTLVPPLLFAAFAVPQIKVDAAFAPPKVVAAFAVPAKGLDARGWEGGAGCRLQASVGS